MRASRIRERRVNLLFLVQGRSRRLLLRKGFKDKSVTIKAKARVNRPKMGKTIDLLDKLGRGHVSISTSLD